ncbi:Dopey, N-terminal, putative [Angomonas deanei]|uniref:Dopey, N-terminal, putative n=1 Tax=Angomonas deanei TaxID=59799 RepID=A0A7G2CAR1_9TRYP|nr:Dopey, N-terminal, putative [Angomonas deanei]
MEHKSYTRFYNDLLSHSTSLRQTLRADWEKSITVLNHMSKLIDPHNITNNHNEVSSASLTPGSAAEILYYAPLRDVLSFSEVFVVVLDKGQSIGVQRRGLELLTTYTVFASSADSSDSTGNVPLTVESRAPFLVDFPFILRGVLAFLPQAPVQLRDRVLQYLRVFIIERLPAELLLNNNTTNHENGVVDTLYALCAALLPLLEESEGNSYYREALSLLMLLYQRTSPVDENNNNNTPKNPFYFATLWSIARDVKELRFGALLLLKTVLTSENNNNNNNNNIVPSFGCDNRFSELVLNSIFVCLSSGQEKVQRLALDILIAFFPLKGHTYNAENNETNYWTDNKLYLLILHILVFIALHNNNNSNNNNNVVSPSVVRRASEYFMNNNNNNDESHLHPLIGNALELMIVYWENTSENNNTSNNNNDVLNKEEIGMMGHILDFASSALNHNNNNQYFSWEVPPLIVTRVLQFFIENNNNNDETNEDDLISIIMAPLCRLFILQEQFIYDQISANKNYNNNNNNNGNFNNHVSEYQTLFFVLLEKMDWNNIYHQFDSFLLEFENNQNDKSLFHIYRLAEIFVNGASFTLKKAHLDNNENENNNNNNTK